MPAVDSRTRIRNIQARLKVPGTGIFDIPTAQAFEALAGYPMRADANQLTHIVSVQMFLKIKVDGVVGPEMLTRVENFLSAKLPPLPAGTSIRVSRRSMDMLIGFEVSSEAQYNKSYQKPIWPGGESGVTIGIGYDLGFNDRSTIAAAWRDFVGTDTLSVLQSVAGLTGTSAKNALPGTRSVIIDYNTAQSVFYQTTLPVYARRTKNTYPGMEKLPPDAQGALLSLVYNRGEGLSGPSRTEMKNIVALVAAQDLKGISKQIRNMKRLWQGKNLPGLLARRDEEASLLEQANFNILSEDIIII